MIPPWEVRVLSYFQFPLLLLLSYIAHLILTISSLLLSLPTSLLPHCSPFSPDITLSLSPYINLSPSLSTSLSLSLLQFQYTFSIPFSVSHPFTIPPSTSCTIPKCFIPRLGPNLVMRQITIRVKHTMPRQCDSFTLILYWKANG